MDIAFGRASIRLGFNIALPFLLWFLPRFGVAQTAVDDNEPTDAAIVSLLRLAIEHDRTNIPDWWKSELRPPKQGVMPPTVKRIRPQLTFLEELSIGVPKDISVSTAKE